MRGSRVVPTHSAWPIRTQGTIPTRLSRPAVYTSIQDEMGPRPAAGSWPCASTPAQRRRRDIFVAPKPKKPSLLPIGGEGGQRPDEGATLRHRPTFVARPPPIHPPPQQSINPRPPPSAFDICHGSRITNPPFCPLRAQSINFQLSTIGSPRPFLVFLIYNFTSLLSGLETQ